MRTVKRRTPTQLLGLAAGAMGIRQTLAIMAKLVEAAKTDIMIRERALAIVAGLRGKDSAAEVEHLFEWVKRSIRYVKDIRSVETVAAPQKTLEYRQGDCDDQVTLLASLLESIGYETRFVAVGFLPGTFTHVYMEVCLDGQWVALDPTEPVPVGWAPPHAAARMVQSIQ